MLDVLNRYAHGFVVVPVVLACRRGGVLSTLEATSMSASDLARQLGANLGHLQVALRLLESLGWIDRDGKGRLLVTPARRQEHLIPAGLWSLVEADFDVYLRTGSGGLLEPWLDNVRARWNADNALMADFLDGMLVVPVLTWMAKRGLARELPLNFRGLPARVRDEVISLLSILGWLEGAQEEFRLSAPGAFMFERAMNLGLAESYRPMLRSMDHLLFGDAESCFAPDANGDETHVNRSMNVVSSGAQHDRYFAEVDEILISIFSREPLSAQPRYVADMGCGDGTFLRRVYTTVRDKTPRGRALDEHPLTLIGIDFNNTALEETSRTLGNIEHFVMPGDIGDPQQLVEDLRRAGVDPARVLHIRSFLDHDRPFKEPADRASLAARQGGRYLGAYANRRGDAISAPAVIQSLVEHLQRWAQIVNSHGLILLEVHCQDPRVVRTHVDQSESLYFDALQGFSHQLLVEADASLMAAAEAGLFPRPEYFRKFPQHLPYSRITLNLFERQSYRVRLAAIADIPALLELEEACWPDGMRMPAAELERRIITYPLGQWLLELQGRVVGVIYSQRVTHLDQLRRVGFSQLSSLHDETGSVIQLLALNVLPEVQHLGLGYQLLDLMLMRSALQGGVSQVAGITRCKDFQGTSLDELLDYVRQTDASGRPIDPILNFHHSHGAELLGLVADFRPEDASNLGAGVLLRYDVTTPGMISRAPTGAGRGAEVLNETADIGTRLETCLRRLLGRRRESAFSWTLPLRDMGLDSLDLLGLRTLLQQTFMQPLSPTFFFSHPTLEDMRRFFERPTPALAAMGQPATESVVLDMDAVTPLTSTPKPVHGENRRTRGGPPAIAIVGMACRFPGCETLDDYWALLASGGDGVTEVPAERWNADKYFSSTPDVPGTIVSRRGGFLRQVDEFDAAFFNISPREARLMDPQQRLLLEMHWEALERSGIDPTRLRETSVGIFVGLSSHDYELLQVEAGAAEDLEAYYATGSSAAIAAGRIAYFLGTRGPALTLDTACSSSLVAVHQAMRSLESGECELALGSGVNLMLSPRLSIAYSRAGMLSPHGRCRTFDAAADGYVRAEGCGVIVMKRLDDARRDGDAILAILRGSDINQDGASNGLTAPSLTAQEQLLRSALKNANLDPSDLDYIEAHGTGTSLGDPVEFHALQSVFGSDGRRLEPLWLGSVKTNIGHAEAAAGIAGLLKVVLSMQKGWLPAHLHFEAPNPHIDLTSIPSQIPLEGRPWQRTDRPLRAGVNSFGFSGTNSHVIVEQAPPSPPAESQAADRSAHVLALSAKSAPALQALARRYADWLTAHPRCNLGDLCHTAGAGRAHHDHRLAVVARTSEEFVRSLGTWAHGDPKPKRVEGAPKIAFLFTGQGSQYLGMARELSQREPAFRSALTECGRILRGELQQPLETLLHSNAAAAGEALDDTANTQPALFAVEYALARMLQAWGVQPAAVMGHSVGEYVAACIAGVFSLEDGLKLIAARGRLMSALPRNGAMLAVLGQSAAVTQALAGESADISVAAYNAPGHIVVSGRCETIDRLERSLARDGVNCVRLQVSHAFHSPLMEPMLPEFAEIASRAALLPPQIEFVSNVTGERASAEITSPQYWCHHIRRPVRFEQGIHALVRGGARVMLEIGPHPVLTGMGRKCLSESATGKIQWLHTLARGVSDWEGIAGTMGALYESGLNIDWPRFDAAFSRRRIDLPTYPWQRQRFWFRQSDAPASKARIGSTAELTGEVRAAPQGRRIHVPGASRIMYETEVTLAAPAFMSDHRVFGAGIVPAPVLMQMALSAATEAFRSEVTTIRDMRVHRALVVPDEGGRSLHLVLTAANAGKSTIEIQSLELTAEREPLWTLHATATLLIGADSTLERRCDLGELKSLCSEPFSADRFYARFEKCGVEFGPAFRAVQSIALGKDQGLAELSLPALVPSEAKDPGVHPILLDAALQTIATVCTMGTAGIEGPDLPALFCGLDRLQVYGNPGSRILCHAVQDLTDDGAGAALRGSARLYADDGTLVARIDGARFVTATRDTLLPASGDQTAADLLFDLVWLPRSSVRHALARPAPDYLPALADVRRRLHLESSQRLADTGGEYRAAVAAFDVLAVSYVSRAFQELGWHAAVGTQVTARGLMDELGIAGRHYRLVARMLDMLAEERILVADGAGWTVASSLPTSEPGGLGDRARAQLPNHAVEIRLFDRCASRLAEVLIGRSDPLRLLFPDDPVESAARLYDTSAMAREPNALMRSLIGAVAAAVPAGRVLRILELGAGTGGTTTHVLPLLQQVSCEYVFSDVSKLFLQQAEEKFRQYPCVQYVLLDIERSPAAQGIAAGQFDLIIAANVLHATRDLQVTLTHVRTLLAPGGMLALIEGIRPARWIDLVFGQTDGWWRFTDLELRPTHPLLSPERWDRVLRASGFAEVATLPTQTDEHPNVFEQAIVMARTPAAAVADSGGGAGSPTVRPGTWLIFGDASALCAELTHRLESAGEPVVRIEVSDVGEATQTVASTLASARLPCSNVLCLWGASLETNLMSAGYEQTISACANALRAAQALIRSELPASPRIWFVTRGAQPAAGATPDPHSAAIWGLGRVLSIEHPEAFGGLIDLEVGGTAAADAACILSQVLAPDEELQCAFRDGVRFVPRLTPAATAMESALEWPVDGCHIVTGGLGGVGLHFAKWMATQGARRLVLLSRRRIPPRAEWDRMAPHDAMLGSISHIREIEMLGAEVRTVAIDIADDAALSQLVESLKVAGWLPVRGVIHSATASVDGLIANLDPDTVRDSFEAKVRGVLQLEHHLADQPLKFFVYCSSVTALLAQKGQANYAAANAFLDAHVARRRSEGQPALGVNWGGWYGAGMAVTSGGQRTIESLERRGFMGFPPATGIAALDLLLRRNATQAAVFRVDWDTFRNAYPAGKVPPLLERLAAAAPVAAAAAAARTADGTHDTTELCDRILALAPGSARSALLERHLRDILADVLRLDAAAIDATVTLGSLGVDSLMGVELRNRCERSLGVRLSATMVWNYPTLADLTRYLSEKLALDAVQSTAAPVGAEVVAPPPAADVSELSEEEALQALLDAGAVQ